MSGQGMHPKAKRLTGSTKKHLAGLKRAGKFKVRVMDQLHREARREMARRGTEE